jgi:hypothetical protein
MTCPSQALAGTRRAQQPRRQGTLGVRPDVAAAPAVPPPVNPDRAASDIAVGSSVMTAAFTHRNVVFDADSGYPGVLSPVAHVGSPPPRRKPSTVFEGLVPYGYSIHLRHRQFPDPPVRVRPLRGAGVWTFTSARIMPGNQGERAGALCPGGPGQVRPGTRAWRTEATTLKQLAWDRGMRPYGEN